MKVIKQAIAILLTGSAAVLSFSQLTLYAAEAEASVTSLPVSDQKLIHQISQHDRRGSIVALLRPCGQCSCEQWRGHFKRTSVHTPAQLGDKRTKKSGEVCRG